MSERTWRVTYLRADEAKLLNGYATNEITDCCAHLDLFHSHGRTEDGGHWKVCNVDRCPCSSEIPPSNTRRLINESEARLARMDRQDIRFTWLILGGILGALIGWLST